MPRFVRSPVTLLGAVGVALLVALLLPASARVASTTPTPTLVTPTIQDMMMRAGLDPEALAAAGVAPSQLWSCAGSLAASPAAAPGALAQIDSAVEGARAAHDELERKVQSGLASESDATQLVAARQALEAAITARQANDDTLYAAGTASLNATQRATLAAIRANRSWSLPVEFLTVNRTEAEWVTLRKALANERIAAKN
ncbi:MAG: hypothetical protein Q8K63_04265, partial [Acidimicrobiales bacterium]|nr:hypothetical protein [Acidimicrobiales bacterium]